MNVGGHSNARTSGAKTSKKSRCSPKLKIGDSVKSPFRLSAEHSVRPNDLRIVREPKPVSVRDVLVVNYLKQTRGDKHLLA